MKLKSSLLQVMSDGLHADGNGLYLRVDGNSKIWCFRYQKNGKRHLISIGKFKNIDLKTARAQAAELQRRISVGECLPEKHETLDETILPKFEAVALKFLKIYGPTWKSPVHRQQWHSTLRAYVYPICGQVLINKIQRTYIRKILEPIWTKKPETARRVRMRIEAILTFAAANGWRDTNNPANMKLVKAMLGPTSEKQQHHAALPYAEMPMYYKNLTTIDTPGSLCLRWLILSACRSNEARSAQWKEIDLIKMLWIIPPERTKTATVHRVSLSTEMLKILDKLDRNSLFLFTAKGYDKPLSDVALSKYIKPLGYTVHGFRSTFRDWAAENSCPFEVAEKYLAHTVHNRTVAAYYRSDLLDQRREWMKKWQNFCLSALNEDNTQFPYHKQMCLL